MQVFYSKPFILLSILCYFLSGIFLDFLACLGTLNMNPKGKWDARTPWSQENNVQSPPSFKGHIVAVVSWLGPAGTGQQSHADPAGSQRSCVRQCLSSIAAAVSLLVHWIEIFPFCILTGETVEGNTPASTHSLHPSVLRQTVFSELQSREVPTYLGEKGEERGRGAGEAAAAAGGSRWRFSARVRDKQWVGGTEGELRQRERIGMGWRGRQRTSLRYYM